MQRVVSCLVILFCDTMTWRETEIWLWPAGEEGSMTVIRDKPGLPHCGDWSVITLSHSHGARRHQDHDPVPLLLRHPHQQEVLLLQEQVRTILSSNQTPNSILSLLNFFFFSSVTRSASTATAAWQVFCLWSLQRFQQGLNVHRWKLFNIWNLKCFLIVQIIHLVWSQGDCDYTSPPFRNLEIEEMIRNYELEVTMPSYWIVSI